MYVEERVTYETWESEALSYTDEIFSERRGRARELINLGRTAE